jgi:hypothetical protein
VGFTPVADPRGWLSLLVGDVEGAAGDGRRILEFTAQAITTPRNAWYLDALRADADLFLGRHAEAIAGATSVVEQTSASADASVRATGKFLAARLLAWAGRPDASVDYLEELATAVPGIAPGDIVYAPIFSAPLAGNPRFRALLQRLEAQMAAMAFE